jgi:hypothetical protein
MSSDRRKLALGFLLRGQPNALLAKAVLAQKDKVTGPDVQ